MAGSPQEVLAAELRRLHRSAGEPGTRAIAKAIKFSHTTVAQALNGSRCPKWNAIEAMVRHLDGDVEAFRPLWQAAPPGSRLAWPAAGAHVAGQGTRPRAPRGHPCTGSAPRSRLPRPAAAHVRGWQRCG